MTVTVAALRWWDIDRLLAIERELFGAEAWPATAFWSELAQGDTRWYRLAEDDGEPVGYAGLCTYPDDAYVQTLAVRRDHQGRGIGRRLLEVLLAEAARRGHRTLALEVRADNARAQRLYARAGFEPIAVRPRYYQPSGTDAVVMHRRLP